MGGASATSRPAVRPRHSPHSPPRASSSTGSSSARSSSVPATPSPEPDECPATPWYQLPSVRLWRATQQKHCSVAGVTSVVRAHAPAVAGTPPRVLAERQPKGQQQQQQRQQQQQQQRQQQQQQRHPLAYSPYSLGADKRRRSNKLWVADVVTGEDGEVVRVGKGPWACPVRGCGQVLRGRDVKTWVRHLDSHWSHVFRRYECPHCTLGFSRPESLIRHSAASSRCQGVRHKDLTPLDPCWLDPKYKQCIDLPAKTHPLYKVLEPVFRGARVKNEDDERPFEPMFGKAGKDA